MIQIKNPADCCGCTACASICTHGAIRMIENHEGFLYPDVDSKKCVECRLCIQVCPILERQDKEFVPNQIAYKALRILDKEKLSHSSSGGAFVAIADYVIEQGGLVFGARYDSQCVVSHSCADTKEGVEKFMGSKYSQSDMGNIYSQIKSELRKNRLILFSGTPCQVAGLKMFLRKPYDNLITVDLVCHAVPSPRIFREYVDFCSKKFGSRIVSIDMRYKKKYGWSHRYAYRFMLNNGNTVVEPDNIEKWSRLFFSMLIDRPSCHKCKFTNYMRPGDLTIADFWDDDKKRLDIYSREGTSLCMVNSEKGIEVLNKISENVELWNITKEDSEQPCLLRSTPSNPKRQEFWDYYHKNGFEKTYSRYFTDGKIQRIKKFVKNVIKHILYGKKD